MTASPPTTTLSTAPMPPFTAHRPSPSSPSSQITAQDAVSYLIAAAGNSRLAAERASAATHTQITEPQFLSLLASDPSAVASLANQVRVFALLHALEAFKLTHMLFLESLDSLPPTAVARTYTDMLKNLATIQANDFTSPNSPASNPQLVQNELLKLLPTPVVEALNTLAVAPDRSPTPDSTIQQETWQVPPRR